MREFYRNCFACAAKSRRLHRSMRTAWKSPGEKPLDSDDEEWECLGSFLPELIEQDKSLPINGLSLALYESAI
jgi:hypothetical protein